MLSLHVQHLRNLRDWSRKSSKLKAAFLTNHKLPTVLRFTQMLHIWTYHGGYQVPTTFLTKYCYLHLHRAGCPQEYQCSFEIKVVQLIV